MRRKTRALGQHMLVDGEVLARIVKAASIGRSEVVAEAGTGLGTLTEELCKRAKRVVSYEVDRAMFQQARARLAHLGNLHLVNADMFSTAAAATVPESGVFVSNLPYSRSRDALEWLAFQKGFGRAVVMVQKEFADKIAQAGPGDANYRAVSALASYCFRIEKLFKVGRQSFEPKPAVESVVIRMERIRTIKDAITIKNLNLLFSQRNKKASSVAARFAPRGSSPSSSSSSLAHGKNNFGDRRVCQLEPAELVMLAESMG